MENELRVQAADGSIVATFDLGHHVNLLAISGDGNQIAYNAWWTAGSNRAAATSYVMPNGGSVQKNQQGGGGAWQTLGTQTLSTGAKNVKLSCWTTASFVVVADAVRIVPLF